MGLSSLGGANVEFTHSHVFAVKYTVPVCEMEREKKYTWVFKVFFFLTSSFLPYFHLSLSIMLQGWKCAGSST